MKITGNKFIVIEGPCHVREALRTAAAHLLERADVQLRVASLGGREGRTAGEEAASTLDRLRLYLRAAGRSPSRGENNVERLSCGELPQLED